MTFYEILSQVLVLLQQEGRVSYRALKRQFDLDEAYLEDLKTEIIEVKRLAIDEEGKVLVWIGYPPASSLSTKDQEEIPPLRSSSLARQSLAFIPLPSDDHYDSLQSQAELFASSVVRWGAQEAERRQVTVMFCDLVGSTELSEQLDPEELREILHAYQKVCAMVINRFEGHLAKYLGDGLLVYFGYPLAHEDDAQRAIRAGLEIVEAIERLNTRLQQEREARLAVRLGIHTGLVVAGEMGGGNLREPLAIVGETPNIAARLQSLADPNTVVISAATYRLIQGYFACQALGTHPLRGFSQLIEVYRVLQVEHTTQRRFELNVSMGLTPLVGREQEVRCLLERWEEVQNGRGQVVLLSGEAGIGKSRLIQVIKEHIMRESHIRLECRCSLYYQHSSLYPVIELCQRMLQLNRQDTPQEKLAKLERTLAGYPVSLPDVIPFYASLLSIPLTERYASFSLSPDRRKQKTLEAFLALLLAMSTQQPVLFVVEDLHWIDPSTLDLLNLLIEQTHTARIFTLLTARPVFHPLWPSHPHLTILTPSRLTRKQVRSMVKQLTGGKTLPAEVLQQLVMKTDGMPLFVEELTKMVLESELLREEEDRYVLTGPLPSLAIPSTLHDSLMARLDRLAPVKAVAQLGATLGREFSYELLQAVSPWDERFLQRELARLVEAELLYQWGQPPQAMYLFKHALIQEAAYQSLLKSTRQQYHQQIAQVLTERFPEMAEIQPELLAHHYKEGGLSEQAMLYWQRAGQRAIQRSAYAEAAGHLAKGLELLTSLPDTPTRRRQELILQTTLGQVLMAIKGHAALEVEQAYTRARALYRQVGEVP
jgi:class 3 adenylate cyclase